MIKKFFIYLEISAYLIRTRLYSIRFGSFGKDSKVLGRIKVYSPENILLGQGCSLNEGVILNARTKISIGNDVHISPGVIINTGALDYAKKGKDRKHLSKPVSIEDGVWIGSGAIINPGVTIYQNSVIGAGSVVTKDIPANSVAVGAPARIIKEI
jgi:acetyltransferase-like isoleucine patch superfamily enzyme